MTRGPLLVLACLFALVAAFARGSPLRAHEGLSLRAAAEIRKDGTFAVDVLLDLEHLPESFGEDARAFAVSGVAPGEDAPRVARGFLAGFAVAFDGRPVPFDAAWSGGRADGSRVALRLTGAVPDGAREVSLVNRLAVGPWAALVKREWDPTRPHIRFLEEGEAMEAVGLSGAPREEGVLGAAAAYVVVGFEHIVPEGLDHILFVLGLFLLSTRLRPLLLQVTAFTVAHSVTLVLSATDAVSLPSSVVEPLIAASIVYVAVENLCTRELRPWRVLLVFGFGLLHGLGFAGALAELGLPADSRLVALLAFNVGVELGQLSVLLVAWLVLAVPFRAKPWYRARVVVPASLAIAAVGLWWAVERLSSASG